MKKYIFTVVFLIAAATAFAVFVNNFTGWSDLIVQSRDIVICRCASTLGTTNLNRPIAINDGLIRSEIEVNSILKGDTKPGLTQLSSQYWPYQGEQFLLFANYENDQFFTGYTAVEWYRIVPLNRHFRTNDLSGKTVSEQINFILSSRLSDLKEEIGRDSEEKRRIELLFTNSTAKAISTNVPAAQFRPSQAGKTF